MPRAADLQPVTQPVGPCGVPRARCCSPSSRASSISTRVSRRQSNGIVERLHRTLLDEHFRVEGRETWFETIEEMQTVLDVYMASYNTKRPHQGRGMNGRTPVKAFRDSIPRTSKKEDKPDPKTAA